MHNRLVVRGWTLLAAALLAEVAPAAEAPGAIRRSDVVFMYDNPAAYEPYGCTVLGWAGPASAERIDAAHRQGVRLFAVSVGFRTEFAGMIDFSPQFMDAACRNFAGEPFIVPWLWDHEHKGQKAWWFCTNSPLYRQFLESRLAERMKAGPDGLHIDDYTGTASTVTWLSGCFCRHCTDGFRDYLAEHVPKEKLAALGITDLAAFDYREFLLAKGVKPEDYPRRRASLPLAAEFLDFQVKADTAYVAEYRRRAEQLRGKPLALAVNSGLTDPLALAIAPELSYFCCEVSQQAAGLKPPTHPVYIYKLAEGLDRPVTSTASGQDWAFVSEHNRPCLVRTWIALSYAFGHNFMAPHRQWCYTKEKGTHWYDGPTKEYAWVYRFVRENARLLDDYEAVAPVAVVYDNAARRQGGGNIEPICTALAERNMPFAVVVAGDDWLDYRLDADRLGRFRAVVIAEPLEMDAEGRKTIEAVRAAGRLVTWPDDAALEKLVPQPITVEGAEAIGVVPRIVPDDDARPAAVHLLNRRYAGERDEMLPSGPFRLRLRHDLFGDRGRAFAKATLHAPGEEPRSLAVAGDGDTITVEVPALTLWGILELRGSKP